VTIVELGSGSSTKTKIFLDAFSNGQRLHYVPIDISESILKESAAVLLETYPNLTITGCVAEYAKGLELAKTLSGQKLILFLGSTIGNFWLEEARYFLSLVRTSMKKSDYLLVGFDMMKDPSILIPAYNDAQGVTAQFTLNILERINRELDGEFDVKLFAHRANFNTGKGHIEIHVESIKKQDVRINKINKTVHFEKGETIHVENSHKFTNEQINKLASESGFEIENIWADDKNWFSIVLLTPSV